MTVIRPNSISGITSITAQANEINIFRSNGTIAGLNLNGINFNTTAGISTLAALKVTGNLDVEGVLTYQDVTNVDSVGIITARSTIDAQGDVSIADKIIHTGDTNTAIRFPDADTFTVETGGNEAFRVDSSRRVLIGTTTEGASSGNNLTIASNTGYCGMTIRSGTSSEGNIFFSDATSGAGESIGMLRYEHNNDAMVIKTNGGERVRIASDGEATFAATNINVNRNAGDAFISLQTSGTSNVALYGGASSGFRVFTKPSGGSLTERVRIKNDGKVVIGNTSGSGTGALTIYPNSLSGNGRLDVYGGGDENSQTQARCEVMRIGRGDILDGYFHSIWSATGSGSANSHFLKFYVSNGTGGNSTTQKEALSMNGNGYVTTPQQPSFMANFGGNNNVSHNNGDYLKANNTDHNTGNCYNTSNYRFTAPVAGNYLFYGRANMSGVSTNDYSRSFQVRLYKNNSSEQFHMSRTTVTGYSGSYPDSSTMVCSINLAANDYVQLKVNWETDGTLSSTENLHHHGSMFGGYLIG